MEWDLESDTEPIDVQDMDEDALSSDDDVNQVQFDKNLPATHSYLPGGLDEIHGRSFLEVGWEGIIPCVAHPHIAFPGEFFPMMIPDTSMFVNITEGKRFFGLICADKGGLYISQFGTLCEVLEATEHGETAALHRLVIKSRTRYRFRILDDIKKSPISVHGHLTVHKFRIKVLPDVVTEDPMNHAGFFSIGKYKSCQDTNLNKILYKSESLNTPIPSFIFKAFDIREIVKEVRSYFQFEKNLNKIPEDLVSMSFWVATHISISSKERLELFKVDNALLRLYLATRHMQKIHSLSCHTCRTIISSRSDYFPMSSEGLTAKYCNVGGFVHDVLTVKSARNVELLGEPSNEFTWFPGYYWTIIMCASCHHHIGWRFDAEESSLRPKYFFGLVRNKLVPTRNDEEV